MRRNEVVHGGAFTDPKQLFLSAISGLEDFQKSNTLPEERSNAAVQSSTSTWLPPPGNMVKINWDAAINQKMSCVSLGILARDKQGVFLAACGVKQKMVADSTMAEALAALYAVIFAKELGVSNVIFEGDALTVMKAVNSEESCESNYGHLVDDVKRFRSDLAISSFVHVGRGANFPAYVLAKEACNHVIDKYWWHSIPSCIGDIIRKEELSPFS